MRAPTLAGGVVIELASFLAQEGTNPERERTVRATILLLALLSGLPLRADPVTVFAAASLKPVLDEVLAEAPVETTAVFAGSSALARQIEAGAPADIFLSANPGWMDHLEAAGRIDAATRRDIARNRLVLVGAPGSPKVAPDDLAGKRIATALTASVPAGLYARDALTGLGLWEELRPSLVEAQDVRAALRLAVIGAVSYAIVYASDAPTEPGVEVLFVFPDESHAPIVYPGALVIGADEDAAAVLDHIAAAREVFAAAGFRPPDPP